MKQLVFVALVVACGRSQAPPAAGDPFWSYFVAHAPQLAAEPLEAAMNDLQHAIEPVHPGVIVELAAEAGKHTLVLSADGDRAVFPTIQSVWAKRPTVPGWTVVAFRQRELERPLPAIRRGDRTLDPSTLRYIGERAGDKLDVVVFAPGYTERDAPLVYIALDHAVGEYDVEMRIGAISIAPLERAPAAARPFVELPAQLDALR
ncbi:MAG TPA: hypothetical protein VGG74_00965 [Kofleriaceae bacterium]|jgi:hypothetical protein